MPIGITPEHQELQRSLRRWTERYCPPSVARNTLEGSPNPLLFSELADNGWLGLHIEESFGGGGFGLAELVVVLEELGRVLFPGALLPTLVAGQAIAKGCEDEGARKSLLLGLASGQSSAALAFEGSLIAGNECASGMLRPVMGLEDASILIARVEGLGWCVLDATSIETTAIKALDSTRCLVTMTVTDAPILCRLPVIDVKDIALVLAAAESAGSSRWCLETNSAYSKDRVQFGRPIGQFQAVKHRLADMLVVVEQIDAAVWDAAQAFDSTDPNASLAAAVVGSLALDGAVMVAKNCVQLLGGIGFTWEHDAHLYLRRALSTRALLGDGARQSVRVCDLASGGARRTLSSELPDEATPIREVIAPLVAKARELEGALQRKYLVEQGLLNPHWTKPWGRNASPLEQLVIDEELSSAGIMGPGLGVGAWALPTLIAHGTKEQQDRWVKPTLLGDISWCQLFSEPGAGSDLASLSTKAEKTKGGWKLNGQKVWTSLAHSADFGICMARTDPTVPKHDGISYFIVDMKSKGIDIRPLRELTGDAMFNEVFMNDVFVEDDHLVGAVGDGWKIGRTTLANERVSMSSGATFGVGVESVLRRLEQIGTNAPPDAFVRVGALLAEAQSIRLLSYRATLRSLSGTDPGAGSSVRKLLGAEHEQRVQEMGLCLYGAEGAILDGKAQRWSHGFLVTRCLTIAGGTSEVQRNVMAERILGQPRDP